MAEQTTTTPLDKFFATYSEFDFQYNKSASPTHEFGRLCRHLQWGNESEERERARARFQDAMVHQFNAIYGTDEHDIAAWQALCARLGVDPIPDTLKECRKIVMKTHVNLVDLTQAVDPTTTVKIFGSLEELRKYTIKNKIFPRHNIHAGSVLKKLLRQIFPRQQKRGIGYVL